MGTLSRWRLAAKPMHTLTHTPVPIAPTLTLGQNVRKDPVLHPEVQVSPMEQPLSFRSLSRLLIPHGEVASPEEFSRKFSTAKTCQVSPANLPQVVKLHTGVFFFRGPNMPSWLGQIFIRFVFPLTDPSGSACLWAWVRRFCTFSRGQ